MENIIIVLVTLSFGLIVFNIINNKKISVISSVLLFIICVVYFIKYMFYDLFIEFFNIVKNVNLVMLIFGCITLIISISEYSLWCKKNKQLVKKEEVNNVLEVKNNKEQLDLLLVYLELFNEPLACFVNDEFIINNKMKKLLKMDSYIIERKKFYSLIYNSDKALFLNNEGINNLRIHINGEYEWFESTTTIIDCIKYCLIKKWDNKKNDIKLKFKTFKELMTKINYNQEKDYYLVFFDIINYTDLISFYGVDFTNLLINKHLSNILDLQYVSENNIFYVSKNEYILLIDNLIEYNILLSELENNSSILTKNDIIISENKITIKGKVGTVASYNVSNKNASNIVSKGFEMVKLACAEDYQLDYAIYHEIDEQINYDFKDLNIDLEFDLSKYKKRIQ